MLRRKVCIVQGFIKHTGARCLLLLRPTAVASSCDSAVSQLSHLAAIMTATLLDDLPKVPRQAVAYNGQIDIFNRQALWVVRRPPNVRRVVYLDGKRNKVIC